MSTAISITEFAPAERVPIEVVQRQSGAMKDAGLSFCKIGGLLNYFVILNQERQIIFASQNILDLSGELDFNNILGKRLGEVIGCIHACDNKGGCGTSEYCSQCGAVDAILKGLKGDTVRQECRLMRLVEHDLQSMDLMVYAAPFFHNNETFCLLSVADISHEKRRRALERIFYHDIINTAGGVKGLLGLIKESAPAALTKDLGMVENGLGELLDEIMMQKELASAEQDELSASPSVISTQDILEEVVDLYRHHLVAEGKEIAIDPQAVQCAFISDATILRRILGNLLKNALEASERGQKVLAGCFKTPEGIQFWVKNHMSMPKEVRLQVFQRSFSTKGADRGLGTYSVKLLTEKYLKGKVSFSSQQGEGTTFFVLLPEFIS